MFIDEARVTLKAGDGGDGVVSWRREKYIPNGGPYGGDGGDGGNIILLATNNIHTLSDFRHARKLKAENGEKGATKEMHGRNGEDLIVKVPVGTIITSEETGEVLVDMNEEGMSHLFLIGGRGGFGNAHFATSTRQAPSFAELGDKGDEIRVKLELKLVADVGIIGLPNAGKSTFISAVTNVRPKIANYAFTTLVPNLGVMEYKGKNIVLEDAPGLIEGAADGKGLGIKFLKHLERTRILLHLVDASGGAEEAAKGYKVVRDEVAKFSEEMLDREEIVALTKADMADSEHIKEIQSEFEQLAGKKAYVISSVGHIGIESLLDAIIEKAGDDAMKDQKLAENEENAVRKYDLRKTEKSDAWSVFRENGDFIVMGERIEQIVRMTDMQNREAVDRVYDVLAKIGALRKIENAIQAEHQAFKESFFEGKEDMELPKIKISERVFPLKKTMFLEK